MISDEEAISSPPGSIFAEIRCCPDNERKLIACSGLLLGLAVSEEDEKVMCRFCPQHGTKVYSCIIFRCWSTRKQACVYRIFIAIVFLYTIVIITLMQFWEKIRAKRHLFARTLYFTRAHIHTRSRRTRWTMGAPYLYIICEYINFVLLLLFIHSRRPCCMSDTSRTRGRRNENPPWSLPNNRCTWRAAFFAFRCRRRRLGRLFCRRSSFWTFSFVRPLK